MSRTFHIQGYEPPVGETILDICFHLASRFQVYYETFEPDGGCFDQPTGIINYYPDAGQRLVDRNVVKTELERLGLTVGNIREEKSGSREGQVTRFPITANPWTNLDTPPELQLANANADLVENLLQLAPIPSPWDISLVRSRIEEVGSLQICQHRRPYRQEGNCIDQGTDFSRIERYLARLTDILDWAQSHGYTHLYLA